MKKKSIIYVDYLCSWGHKTFNDIYLTALSDYGYSICFFTEESYFKSLKSNDNICFHAIPDRFLRTRRFWFIRLIWKIKMLQFLRKKSQEMNCDFLFFSFFGMFEHFFVRFKKKKIFLVIHNNARFLTYSWARIIFKRIAREQTFLICLDDNLGKLLSDFSIRNVIKLFHGLPVYPVNKEKQSTNLADILLNNFNIDLGDKTLLYVPNFDRSSADFKSQVFSSRTQALLKNKNLYLLIKTDSISFQTDVIGVIPKVITSAEHGLIFHNSSVILDYQERYKFRASALANECILYNVPFFTNVIKSEYSNMCKYNPYYSDFHVFISDWETYGKSQDMYDKSSCVIEIDKLAMC